MNHNVTTGEIFSLLEQWAPKSLAYDWDPVGLQVGSYNEPVKKIMVTLDVDQRVIDEAIEQGVNLIIAHHPLLFKPLQSINTESSKGRIIQTLIRHNITVYASHTNLDIATGGVNDMLAKKLKLEETSILVPTKTKDLYKIVVFVPNDYAAKVKEAICGAGGGHIGNYRDCTFKVHGEGSFRPLDGSEPFIGEKNTLTRVEETRLETIVEEDKLQYVIQALKQAHPYEEVAYDVYLTENKDYSYGLGRIGMWTSENTVSAVIQEVKDAFNLSHVRFVGNEHKPIKKIAIVGGSGEKFISAAKNKGADLYITGDITYHAAQEAEQLGLAIIDAGHYIEHVMKEATATYLEEHLSTTDIQCIESTVHTNPFSYQ